MSETNLRRSERWSGRYRGISFDVLRVHDDSAVRHMGRPDNWFHYIYVAEFQIPESERGMLFLPWRLHRYSERGREHVIYDYNKSAFADLEWHCGITFYEMLGEAPGHRVVKAGCDYQHLWDVGEVYSERFVAMNARRTIDSLHERVQVFGICSIYGCLRPVSEMQEDKGGGLTCVGCRERWAAECDARREKEQP